MKKRTMKTPMRFLFGIFLIVLGAQPTYADKTGQSTTIISFGGYQTTNGTDTVNGSQLAIAYVRYFADQWSYFGRLGNASGSGQHTENGRSITINAATTTLSGGLQWSKDIALNADKSNAMMPFIRGGLSLQQYTYDFAYQDSETGKTSGTGYGPLLMLGVKLNLSDHFTIIPGYHHEIIYIKSEEGDRIGMTSSGMVLALVARF